jgi:hypothetical protein
LNRKGRTGEPVASGITISPEGGRPKEGECVKQKGQCSKCVRCSAGAELCSGFPAALSDLLPWAVQISLEGEKLLLPDAATAWEIDGASAAIRIAKQAIHAVKRCLYRLKPMLEIRLVWLSLLDY